MQSFSLEQRGSSKEMEPAYWALSKIHISPAIVTVELVSPGEKWFSAWDAFLCICSDRERIVTPCYAHLKKSVTGSDISRSFWGDLKKRKWERRNIHEGRRVSPRSPLSDECLRISRGNHLTSSVTCGIKVKISSFHIIIGLDLGLLVSPRNVGPRTCR